MSKDKCRICLKKGMMLYIFEESYSVTLASKIMSLANIQIHINDGLPSTICRKCERKLDCCIEFVQQCETSDKKLKALLLPQDTKTKDEIKIEDTLCVLPKNENSEHNFIEEESKHSTTSENVSVLKDFPTSSEDRTEIKVRTHRKTEKQQCFTCGKIMSSRFRLKTHLRIHSGERPFSCPHCSKTFTLAQNLKIHLRIHTGEKPLKCTECEATFAHSSGLSAHMRKHTGHTPYCCTLCPRSFRTFGHLQYHVRRHTGEKNFECDACGRMFITRSQLKQHVVSHSGEKPHVCSECGLRLSRASHLRRHTQLVHNLHRPEQKEPTRTNSPSKDQAKADISDAQPSES
ncbi:zinc finger protein 695-like [Pectinophora gossypiella]|uniref:zinc finger protein 695-like n=1 Tax=Pectinophora gossypiella TaxID=13191 RepID=UPI00214EFDF7|nr:zinc finger protein 695-like [Pectinophora gossypiella]